MKTGHWSDGIIPWTSNVHYYIADYEWKASCSIGSSCNSVAFSAHISFGVHTMQRLSFLSDIC